MKLGNCLSGNGGLASLASPKLLNSKPRSLLLHLKGFKNKDDSAGSSAKGSSASSSDEKTEKVGVWEGSGALQQEWEGKTISVRVCVWTLDTQVGKSAGILAWTQTECCNQHTCIHAGILAWTQTECCNQHTCIHAGILAWTQTECCNQHTCIHAGILAWTQTECCNQHTCIHAGILAWTQTECCNQHTCIHAGILAWTQTECCNQHTCIHALSCAVETTSLIASQIQLVGGSLLFAFYLPWFLRESDPKRAVRLFLTSSQSTKLIRLCLRWVSLNYVINLDLEVRCTSLYMPNCQRHAKYLSLTSFHWVRNMTGKHLTSHKR